MAGPSPPGAAINWAGGGPGERTVVIEVQRCVVPPATDEVAVPPHATPTVSSQNAIALPSSGSLRYPDSSSAGGERGRGHVDFPVLAFAGTPV